MLLDKNKRTNIEIKKLYVKEIKFSREVDITDNNLKIGVENNSLRLSNGYIELSISSNISNDKGEINVVVEVCGIFKILNYNKDIEFTDEELEKMMLQMIDSMYPYLRSQVSVVTSQPDLKPIILPIIDFNHFEIKKLQMNNK